MIAGAPLPAPPDDLANEEGQVSEQLVRTRRGVHFKRSLNLVAGKYQLRESDVMREAMPLLAKMTDEDLIRPTAMRALLETAGLFATYRRKVWDAEAVRRRAERILGG
jgi:hypothetical protein